MSISAMPEWNVTPPPDLPMRRFTVDEYHRMIEAGVFPEEDRLELLEGWIIAKMPRNPPHDVAILVVQRILGAELPAGWHFRAQMALTTPDSKPEPDLAVVRGEDVDYLSRHPTPADVALVIEVSDSTLAGDRDPKGRIYARAGLPVYWIVNLVDHRVEIYSSPTGPDANPRYRERRVVEPGETIPLLIDGREVARINERKLFPGRTV